MKHVGIPAGAEEGTAHRREPVDAAFCVSVVVPVHNEDESLDEFISNLTDVLRRQPWGYEVVSINDGSTDGSLPILIRWHQADPAITVLDLSRQFGKEAALRAGLEAATGDAIVFIDADLQHPPELIPRFVDAWRSGFDVVHGKRIGGPGASWARRLMSTLFLHVFNGLSSAERLPRETSDFRLVSRRAAIALLAVKDSTPYIRALIPWTGFSSTTVDYRERARAKGSSRWRFGSLVSLAISAICAHSIKPLRLLALLGASLVLSALGGAFVVVVAPVFGQHVSSGPVWSILITSALAGVQLLGTALVGEYVARTLSQVSGRPPYLLRARYSANAPRAERGRFAGQLPVHSAGPAPLVVEMRPVSSCQTGE